MSNGYDNSFLLLKEDDNEINSELMSSKISFFEPVGFENNMNDNNCFVSVVFHALYHFTKLKNFLIDLELTVSTPPIIVELKSLLSSYQMLNKEKSSGEENKNKYVLNPINFRNALDTKQIFHKNKKGDPIELLNYILTLVHNYLSFNSTGSNLNFSSLNSECKSNDCVIHQLFYIDITEICHCYDCNYDKTLKYDNNYFMQLLNVDLILYNIQNNKNFDELNGKIFCYSKLFPTQSPECQNCKKHEHIQNIFKCNSIGKYFIVNLSFDGNEIQKENLCYIYTMIGREFNVKDLYEYDKDYKLYFMGMFLYWSYHYICLFFSPNIEKFVMYDDKTIKYFDSWKDLIKNLILNEYQPVALLYGEYEGNKLNNLKPFNIDKIFFDNILKETIEKDKKRNKIGIAMPNVKIKENEWICDECKNINNMINDICEKCHFVNETVKEMNSLRYLELKRKDVDQLNNEEKDFINKKKKKNKNHNEMEKCICIYCGCNTNSIQDKQCKICSYPLKQSEGNKSNQNQINENKNNNNQNKMIIKKNKIIIKKMIK